MDFIHRVPNLLSDEFCKDLIELFEKSNFKHKGTSYVVNNGVIETRDENTTKKSTDISMYPGFIEDAVERGEPEWFEYIQYINSKLEKGLDSYMLEHPALDSIQKFDLEGYNIQRYLPGEGFYNWHCENPGYPDSANRVLAFMIYLNDVEDGGTQFKSQNHTEKAEAGKFLIWPAFWTHYHKGQVSETQTKYIITGWYKHINN
jgi:hypothetical protein